MRTDATKELCRLLDWPEPSDYGLEVEEMLEAAVKEIKRLRKLLEDSRAPGQGSSG